MTRTLGELSFPAGCLFNLHGSPTEVLAVVTPFWCLCCAVLCVFSGEEADALQNFPKATLGGRMPSPENPTSEVSRDCSLFLERVRGCAHDLLSLLRRSSITSQFVPEKYLLFPLSRQWSQLYTPAVSPPLRLVSGLPAPLTLSPPCP